MSRRPLVITSLVAVLSCTLMGLAIAYGWLGEDVGRGANFCEAARDSFVRQPANTFSNAGFVIAGLLIAWHSSRRAPSGVSVGMATAIACLVVLLGPGSAAMHATQSEFGGTLDMTSMYLVSAFAAAYATMRWRRTGLGVFAVMFLAGVAFGEVAGLWKAEIPVVMYAGNVAFALMLLYAIAVEIRIRRRGGARANLAFAIASLASIITAFVIWNASKTWLCDPHSLIQGHAIWHVLGAVSAYFLYRYYASEKQVS